MALTLAIAGSLALVQPAPAWPADQVTREVHFEGLDCGDDAFQVYVAALAAAQNLGYEIRNSSTSHRSFESRLKQEDRRIKLSVEITCSGADVPGFEAFFGSPGVAVDYTVRARRGGAPAVSHEAALFAARLRQVADSMLGMSPEACLGISVRDSASLEAAVRSRLGAETGVLVAEVHSSGPAAAAGLEPWDVLVGIDGVEMTGTRSPIDFLRGREPGSEVALLVIRDGETRRVTARLGRRSEDGSCAAVKVLPATRGVEAASTPALEIRALEVVPRTVSRGSPFDVAFALALTLPSPNDAEQDVTLDVEVLRDGEVLYRPSATTVSCRNGAATEVVRHLRAGRDPGSYELRLTATSGELRVQETVPFEIR